MEARVELAEAMLGDLRDRFTRFQNRENMRGARQVSERDQQLAEEVAVRLSAPENRASDSKASKLDLWKGQH